MDRKIERKINFDLDGVLADFDRRYTELTGIAWKHDPNRSEAEEEIMWARLADHPEFFLNLPLIPGAICLVTFVMQYSQYTPAVLSAASRRIPQSKPQKVLWCRREMPWMATHNITIVDRKTEKVNHVSPGDVLIDDHPGNIAQWQEAGGVGIFYVNAAQTLVELQKTIQAPVSLYNRMLRIIEAEIAQAK